MYSASLLSLEGEGHKWGKFLEVPYSPVVNTTCDIVLGIFIGHELMIITREFLLNVALHE